ncbi:MAG: type II toxin-antitoxin system RelE/ParE family toxin [Candidatus Adiutrix sp.]|jgi:plasmid stabilization system protein ParE|nr:type II toxin-antitoxin system RelE/ParE family toxin [Candidatus Adiutrix sp.]
MSPGRVISWAAKASDDLDGIVEYIAKDNEEAAQEFYEQIMEAVDKLAASPIGRRGELPGAYERVLTRYPSYMIIYTLAEHAINIIRIFHTSQQKKL